MDLQEALGFTHADLEANQIGRLSAQQRETLQERQARSWDILRWLTMVIIGMTIGAVLISGPLRVMLSSTALITAVMVMAEYVIGYRTYTLDLRAAHIETLQGVVQYVQRRESVMGIEPHPAGISIAGTRFLLLEDQVLAFDEGAVYAVHIAPATQTLLSAERVFVTDTPHVALDAEVAYWEDSAVVQSMNEAKPHE